MAWERRGRRPLLTLAFLLVMSFRVKADNLEVKRLQRFDTNSLKIFCATTNGVTPDDATDQYELSFMNPAGDPISLVSTSQASGNPQVFEVNVEELYGSLTVFALALKVKEDQAVKASSDVTFTLADVSGVKASWVGARKTSETGEVLRLYGHPLSVLACPEGGEDNKDCLDFPKEENYRASSGLSGATAVLCIPTEGDPAVPFCLVTVDIVTAAGSAYRGEVRLSHQEDQTAPAEGTLSVRKDIGAGEKRDLLYWSDGRLLACLGSTSCRIQDFPSSDDLYDVFFVDYQEADGEITGSSLVMKFEDYSPIGTVIKPNMLEIRWTQTRNQYKLILTDIDGEGITTKPPPFTSAIVNCEDMKECFGYFIDLPPGDFKAMVRPWTGSNQLEQNSVLSSKQTIQNSESKSSDLKIQEVALDWSSDGSKAFPKVCFTNKAVTSKNLSHFELVIVDQKGHWIRSRDATQKTEGVTCFTGVTLSSDELLIPGKVTVIVIERDLDGLNVMASAHAEAFFKRSLDLVITKFEIVDIISQKFSIHYTGASGTLSGGELSATNINDAKILNMELTGVSETRADFLAADLLMSWINDQTPLMWMLRLHADDGNGMFGKEQFTFPDVRTFPTCDPAHLIGKKQVVRLNCDGNSNETDTIQMTDDEVAIQASTGVVGVSYHLLDKPATLPASVQLCRKPKDNGNVDICTRHVELTDATTEVTAMTEVKVEYDAKITVQQTPPDGNSLDGLVYYYQETSSSPTLKYCPQPDCEVQGYKGVQNIEVLVVYKDDTTGKSVESQQRTVYGLELKGAQITSSVSELAIKKMPERDVYQVIIDSSTAPGMEVRAPTFTTAKVMCQDVEIVCYAYFSLPAGGKYKATVSPYEDKAGDGNPDKMNQIVSLEMTPLQYREKRGTEFAKNLILKQINRVKSDTETLGTDLTVFNELDPIGGIASVTLLITHDNGDEYIAISTQVGDGIIEQGAEKVFHFDINPLDNISPKTTVFFIAKNTDNVALAEAGVTVEFKTLDPTMDWVGGADTAPLRVKTDLDVEINVVPFAAGTSYSLDFESDPKPVEVCVTLENTEPDGGTVRQCDLTRSVGSYKDMDVGEVELNLNDGKRVMTVTSTFVGMEAVLYNEGDTDIVGETFSCTTENICSSVPSDDLLTALNRVFKVLVVGKDATDLVTGAKVVDFEDFQTFVQRFSDASDLEVRWEASINNDFTVHLDNDVPDGFTDVAVQCGGAEQRACKAYFTNLKPAESYTAKVIKENTVVSFTSPATAGSTVPLSITQLSEVSTSPLQMELTFSADADVTGVEYIEYVVIDPPVDGVATQRIVFKDTADDITTGDNSITFNDAELPDAGPGSTVLAVVHGPDGVHSDALAAGKVVAAFKAINPTMSWVGEANTAPLRVNTNQDVKINGVPFAAGTSYSLDFASAPNPVEVCATLDTTAPAGGTVRQCDMTRSIQDFQELNVDNIELNYDEGKHVMTVSSTFAGLEAVLYHGGDTAIIPVTFSCDTRDTCISPDISGQISGLSPTFKVLVVGMDAGAVTGANVVDFEDFQVRVQRFSTAGDLEVRWQADNADTYKIHLNNDAPDGFTDVSVACGGADAAANRACKAYFTKLEADKPYKAELKRDNTVVSATVPAAPGAYTPVTISRIAVSTPSQTQLTFSSEAEVLGVEYVECVLIDPPVDGEAKQRIVFKDTTDVIAVGENDITFDVGELPNPGAESTVLVVVHGPGGVEADALAAGKVTVVFEVLNPTMNWVGGTDTAPLRVKTDLDVEINGVPFGAGTFYSLDFESAPNPVEVCVTLGNTAPAGGTVRQCDMTRSVQEFQVMAVDAIELNFDEGKHVMTVSSTFAGLEAVLYQAEDKGIIPVTFSCDTPETCISPDINAQISGLSSTFKVLVVGMDAGAVTGANVVDFEDFQVRVQRFSTAGDLEVRWRADNADTYKIHLNNDAPDGFTGVSVACGGADAAENRACKAYFTKLEADKPYKAELQRGNKVVSATVPAATGTDTPVTITRIAVSTPSQTQLTFSAEAEVPGVEYVECVVIDPPVDGEAKQRIVFKDTTDAIAVGENYVTFDVGELPNSGAESTVLVVVHGPGGVDADALAAGKVVVTFQVINPTMTWVGGPDTAPLRIETSQKLDVNGNACDAGTSYILDFEANPSPPELCVALVDAAEGGTVLQCDVTQTIQNAGDLSITTVELNYDEGKHVMTVSSTFAGLEAVLYHGGDTGIVPATFSCDTPGSCISPDISGQISGLSPTFKVLAVGMDPGAVTGAKVVDFEDFQVRVQRFSGTGDVEVRWRASDEDNYKIHLNNDAPDGFTDVSVACGGAAAAANRACKAYFTKLGADKPYKAELQRGITVVSATVPAGQGSGIPVTITEIAQVSMDPLQTQLTVTADKEVIGIETLEFVVIDPPSGNEATQRITFKSVNCIINVDTTAVFDVEQLPSEGVELTLLFVVHGRDGVDSKALAAGKVVVTLEDIKPTINWVGGQDTAPLRIHANQDLVINDIQFPEGTFYLLDFDGSSSLEICVTLDNTAAAGGTLNQCDLTQTPQNVADMAVQKVELSHEEEGKSTITVSSTFTSMEAVMYDAGESGKVSESFSCTTENTCSSDVTAILAGLKPTFKFLAVGVADPDTVSGAKLIDVEDFQTSALRFSDSGVVEVRWRASSDQLFNVHVNNEGSGGFTDVSVQCGGSGEAEQRACKAYYTMLKVNTAYKAEVQKDIVAVSTAVPAATASVTPLDITRISKVSDSSTQTQLTVSAAAEVTGIQYVDFVTIDPPKDNIAPQHIAFSEAPESIDANGCIITFDDTDQPQMLVGVTVLVVAHGVEGSDSDILASGEVIVYFADLVPPKMTKVGSEEMKSLKVENGDLDVRVNGKICRAKSVCYFLEFDTSLEPPEVCRDAATGVEQCDMTGSYVATKLLDATGLDLMYKGLAEEELRVTANFDASSVTMETMIYGDAGTETSTPLTCTIESASCVFPVTPQNTVFKILLMALDNQAGVVESNTIEFEDFQTRMEQLTNTDLEVSWKSSQASNFTVTMNPPPQGFPSVLAVECGGEQPEDSDTCIAFFLLLPEGAGCTANVNRRGDDAKTVSAFLQLEITEGFSAPITITRLIARERADKKPSLSVCFEDELFANGKGSEVMTQAGSLKYSLVVVDAFGRQLLSSSDLLSLSSSSSVEDDLCFGDLSLGFDFDLRQKLRVIVKRERMEGERVRAVGDIEAYLLDPHGLIDVRQVGPRTVRVGWKDVNRALGYEVLIGALRLAGECDEEQDPQCVRYLHMHRGESPLLVTLKAVDARVSQEVEVPLSLQDLSTLRIYSTALTDENHVQVCFNPAPKASHYLLGLEDEKGLVLESRRVFPHQEDDFTCVLSAEEVDLGGYLSLRTLVTAFDASDMPVASGTATIQEFFLSPKRKVLTVVNETNHDLITTWYLLDDPEKITSYYVTLEQATDGRKNDDPVVLSSTVTSHVFEGVAPGRYSVCVAASVEGAGSVLRSREVCSDIFSVPGVNVEIPEVSEMKVKTTGLDKALVTWQKPGDEDDVTHYVITWTKAAPSSNSAVSSTRNQARARQPLPIVAQGFRDVEPGFREQGRHHRIVPASSPSVEVLTLDPKKAYEVCVSAVRKGVAGNHICKGVELGKDDPVDSPTDLVFENDLLKWNEVVSASGYLVEWRPRRGGMSSGGQEEVKTTSWSSGNLSPGRWVVSVRATTETSASKPVSADYLKEGIEIVSAVQVNNNQLLIRWQEEPRPPCAESKCNYAITTSYNQAPLWHSCSGLKGDCERAIEVQGGTQVEVALERDGVKSSVKEMVFAFPAMSDLNQRSLSGGRDVTVSWKETEDATLYNVTLFSDSSRSSIKLTEMLNRELFTLHENEVEGSVLLIQPCADKTHCGSGQNITMMSAADTPSGYTPVLATSVVGGVIVLIAVALVVTVVIMKRVKRKEADDTCRLEEVARADPIGSQRSIGLHSSVQVISLSSLSHEGNERQ